MRFTTTARYAVLLPVLAFLVGPAPVRAQATDEQRGWSYRLTPYLWFSGLDGTIGAGGRPVDVEVSFSDMLKSLDLAFMLALEARQGKTLLLLDSFYARLSDDADPPGPLFSGAEFTSQQLMLDLEFGSFLKEGPQGSVALLVGGRYWNMKTSIDLAAGTLPAVSADDTKDWFDPVIGVLFRRTLSPKWYTSVKADLGGFGIGSDFTWQFLLAFDLNLTAKSALVFGYRYLDVDYDSGGFTYDAVMQGPVLGYQFRF